MPGDLPSPPGPWKLEDGRGNYKRKAGTRAAAWKTLDGSRRELDTNDKFTTRKKTDTAWHGSQKGFALRMDMHLNVEVQMKGSVSGDITLSAEALYVWSPPPSDQFFLFTRNLALETDMTHLGALNDVYMMYLYACCIIKEPAFYLGQDGLDLEGEIVLVDILHFLDSVAIFDTPLNMYGWRVTVVRSRTSRR